MDEQNKTYYEVVEIVSNHEEKSHGLADTRADAHIVAKFMAQNTHGHFVVRIYQGD